MSGILCLKWNNHTSTFIQHLEILRCKELYCDATLTCYGKYYPVHRFVLTTCSEYFEEIFSRAQCKHPFIILNDINHMQLEALLQYMYKGEVNVLQENLPGLIRAAEALKVKGLAVPEDETEDKKLREKKIFTSSPIPIDLENISKPDTSLIEDDCTSERETDINCMQNSPNSSFESHNSKSNDKNSQNGLNISNENIDQDQNDDDDDDDDQSDLQENETNPIKLEAIDEQEEKFKISYINTDKDPPSFLSLINSEKDPPEVNDSVGEFAIPQCSSWTDSLPNSDTVNKENLESPWLHSSDYDSFHVDPLHYLSTSNSESPTYSSFSLTEPNLTIKEEKKSSGNKNHKYQCNECQFSTNDKAAFRLHTMRKHTGEKPFGCAICTYRCTTKDMLKIHTRKHTGEKPFSCPYCNCRMTVKSSLKRHILLKHIQNRKPKTQSNDVNITAGTLKTYKCTFCSYESQMKSNLKLHCMRIHTGEKPVACHLCPYRTTTKPQLEKHMRKHTGEKPFACTFCTYKAAQKHTLLRHMALHTK